MNELEKLKKENEGLKEKIRELEVRLQTNRGEIQKKGVIQSFSGGDNGKTCFWL